MFFCPSNTVVPVEASWNDFIEGDIPDAEWMVQTGAHGAGNVPTKENGYRMHQLAELLGTLASFGPGIQCLAVMSKECQRWMWAHISSDGKTGWQTVDTPPPMVIAEIVWLSAHLLALAAHGRRIFPHTFNPTLTITGDASLAKGYGGRASFTSAESTQTVEFANMWTPEQQQLIEGNQFAAELLGTEQLIDHFLSNNPALTLSMTRTRASTPSARARIGP
eukprot:COSAG01_NODE_573_length_15298_cov_13.922394_5_plen_221_part_00